MGSAIGELFPLAVALACGPLPIIALVLILVSKDARSNGLGFVAGRLIGLSAIVAVTLVIFSLIGDPSFGHHGHPSPAVSIARIVIGAALIGLGVWKWRKRNEPEEPSAIAKRVDGLTAGGALRMGVLVCVVDPSCLALGLLAGVDIADAKTPIASAIVVAAGFVLVSTISIIIPMLAFLAGGQSAQRKIGAVKDWLLSNEQAVMMVLCFVVGAMLVGRGIRDLAGL
jgi:threonine/homoserine/homoserine lactone efflux protein